MKVLNEFPPNIEAIKKVFPLHNRVVFTYGKILYNPGGWPIPHDLMVHEETHTKQQGKDPEGWWKKYLEDKQFRLTQELEAYRNQWRAVLRGDQKNKMTILRAIVKELSGELYGNIISYEVASRRITE